MHRGPSGRVYHQARESPGDLGSAGKKSFAHLMPHLFLRAGHTDSVRHFAPADGMRVSPLQPEGRAVTSRTERATAAAVSQTAALELAQDTAPARPAASVVHPSHGRHGTTAGKGLWQ